MSYFILIGSPSPLKNNKLHLTYENANSSKVSQKVMLKNKRLHTYFCTNRGCSTDILEKSNISKKNNFLLDIKQIINKINVVYFYYYFFRQNIFLEKISNFQKIKIDINDFNSKFPFLTENQLYIVTKNL